jgi:tripartite-type tricarboxylate transporter receptor subunit TctC
VRRVTGDGPVSVGVDGRHGKRRSSDAQICRQLRGGANNSVPHVQSGAIKAYAFEAERCSPIFPEVPTAKEVGPPAFQVLAWLALFAPKATPKPILDELTNALDKALDDHNVRKRFFDIILEIPDKASRVQQPLATLVKRDIARWTQILKAVNIKEE